MTQLNSNPLPVYTPVTLNTGGGFFGAVRRKINSLTDFDNVFGIAPNDRIYPGRAPPKTSMPYLVMNHVSCILDDYLGISEGTLTFPLDLWKETVQLSVYADNYETARQLARAVHARISRHTFVIDCYPCFIYPLSRSILLDANRSERGGDFWHVDSRYYYWGSELVFRDDYIKPDSDPWFGRGGYTDPLPPIG